MHDFGKLSAYPEQIVIQSEIKDADGNIIIPQRTASILTLKDKDGNIWHDLFRLYPHAFYIAINDNDIIISMTDDPEQSQIPDHRIIGIDKAFGETYGPGGSVYGKKWDGSSIVALPPVLPDLTARQIRLGLLELGFLADVDRIIAGFPSPLKEQAEIEWNYGTSFSRNSPLLKSIMQQLELSDEEVDTHWQRIAKI